MRLQARPSNMSLLACIARLAGFSKGNPNNLDRLKKKTLSTALRLQRRTAKKKMKCSYRHDTHPPHPWCTRSTHVAYLESSHTLLQRVPQKKKRKKMKFSYSCDSPPSPPLAAHAPHLLLTLDACYIYICILVVDIYIYRHIYTHIYIYI